MTMSAITLQTSDHARVRDVSSRAVGLCGALAVVVGALGSVVADVTAEGISPTSSAEDLLVTYGQYLHRLQVGAALSLVAFALQVVFLGALWARLRASSERIALVAVLGGLGSAATLWMMTAVLDTAMATAADLQDADAARFLLLAGWDTARVATAPNAVLISACMVAGWRYGLFPRSLTAFSAVLLLASIAGMFPVGPAGGSALIGGLWIAVTSVYLALRPGVTPLTRQGRSGTQE
jgi:hypothetical protein